jgi:hypothetical protein
MTWTKHDDLFTEQPHWDHVSYPARWHYLALVQACSRSQRWDGRLPLTVARRASDVPDPDRCHQELESVGLVALEPGVVVVIHIDDYIPPPYIRENAAKSKERMRRMRQKKSATPDVTGDVTRNTGTGLDGTVTGQALQTQEQELLSKEEPKTGSKRTLGVQDHPAVVDDDLVRFLDEVSGWRRVADDTVGQESEGADG